MTYNLFISHSWTYSDAYEKLLFLLEKDKNFSFRNYSIPKDDPVHSSTDRELRLAITNKMQFCHCVLVLAGVYSTYSKWINKEINIAETGFTVPKPIIAIEPWGSERTSQFVKEHADRIVGWNSAPIIRAIQDLSR